jgi:hypothetical protein
MRNRQYLTSKGNTLFSVKRSFSNENKVMKKGLPINSDEESCLVAGVVLLGMLPREYRFGVRYYKKPILVVTRMCFFTPGPISKLKALK